MLLKERWEARPPEGVEPELWRLVTTDPSSVLEAAEDEKCLRHFRHFARRAWREVDGHDPVWEWYHDVICDHLQAVFDGRIKRLLINIPPRMSKSTIVSVLWPAWCWLHDPTWRIFAASAVDGVVTRDAMRMRDLVASDWYQQTFQPVWGFAPAQDAKGYFVNTARGHRISRTVGQKLQGVDADVEIIDDPLDERDAKGGAANLTEHVAWLRDRALERLTHPDRPVVVIMQRLHELDVSGWCLDQGWDHLILPAVMEGALVSDEGQTSTLDLDEVFKLAANDDRELWPANVIPLQRSRTALGFVDPRPVGGVLSSRLPLDFLIKRWKSNARGFASKFQQRPAPAEGAVFRKEWFKFWTPETLPKSFDYKVVACDTTFKKGRSNDWVVIQVWGVKGANVYLLEQVRKRLTFDQAVDAIREVHARHPGCRATLVEQSGNGPAIVAALKATIPGVVSISVQGDTKESRAAVTLPRWIAGQVYLPHPHEAPWVEKYFIPEHLVFPAGQHDDQVDAGTLALIWIGEHPVGLPIVIRV